MAPMSAHLLQELRAGNLTGTARLDLSAGLTEIPPEVLGLADSLEVLNLSGNALTDLPDWLPQLRKLRILFCSHNPFRHVPEILGQCPALDMIGFKSCQIETVSGAALPPALRWLILTDNHLAGVPPELGRRPALQKLMLSGNRLSRLPDEMEACRNLELLRLASNRFGSLPPWLLRLPRLAWLAIAGNPLTKAETAPPSGMAKVDWAELTLGPVLGQGASGVIHQALWHAAAEQPAVAVKLFKGAMTSDGLPASELAACLMAGGHPQVIGATGQITGHPTGAAGLVMPLIGEDFRPLAGPPDLASCTRDIYPEALELSLAEAWEIARSIAAAACHLHGQRILHGDLYAHNVLWRAGGAALLGDFGAAASYQSADPTMARALERIEVRAFGCLLGELLDQVAPAALTALPLLRNLQAQCLTGEVPARPDFRAVLGTLESMEAALLA